jgi:hypothetical protein
MHYYVATQVPNHPAPNNTSRHVCHHPLQGKRTFFFEKMKGKEGARRVNMLEK